MADPIARVIELNMRRLLRDVAQRAVVIHPAWLARVGVGDVVAWATERGMVLSTRRQLSGRAICVAHKTLGD